METVTDDAEIQCEIISMPTCSTPLCSPVKSAACPADDVEEDVDYVPPCNLFLDEEIEEEKDHTEERDQTKHNESK